MTTSSPALVVTPSLQVTELSVDGSGTDVGDLSDVRRPRVVDSSAPMKRASVDEEKTSWWVRRRRR